MARPRKNNAEYFSHDAGMRDDPKIKALRKKFKSDGYAVWCMLLELLTSCEGFRYKWNNLNVEIMAGDFDIEAAKIREIIDYMVILELVTIEDGYVFSPKHIKRFSGLLAKRNRDNARYEQEQSGKETSENEVSADGNTPEIDVFADGSTHSIVKESKEENKEEIYRCFAHLKMTTTEFNKLMEAGFSKGQIDDTLDSIENYKKNKQYTSLYLTANKWLKKNHPDTIKKQDRQPVSSQPDWQDELNKQRLAAIQKKEVIQ